MKDEILHSIEWNMTKINGFLEKIVTAPPPVELKRLKFYHGVYLESLFSLIDYMDEMDESISREIKYIMRNLGDDSLYYFRELHYAITHRGFDISTHSNIVENNVRLMTPECVLNRDGLPCPSPKENILLKSLLIFDMATRVAVLLKLSQLGCRYEKDREEDEYFESFLANINNAAIPGFVKGFIFDHRREVKEKIDSRELESSLIIRVKELLFPESMLNILKILY
ncbi:hypothetical protein [Musicola paradisiaca]|uniref:Uncharacterized protein n=1 Tax=Musicola paradisiaca (strain Ech703) TaxID=579405 RepID=C6C8U0_MUSP7|nr:hypothetical protein [Musicola paradisiaca]ACS84311.1 hypothetical protein Dd703_0500 [Musicola paradisiaca Ech703]